MWIMMLLKSENHVNTLLKYLSSKHPNIKLTCETEKGNSLAFLGTKVHKSNNSLKTLMDRKSIF